MDICMKVQTTHLPHLFTATHDAAQLYAQHSDLKHKLWRSAHTDDFTRTERDQMRAALACLSEAHRSVTGAPLK